MSLANTIGDASKSIADALQPLVDDGTLKIVYQRAPRELPQTKFPHAEVFWTGIQRPANQVTPKDKLLTWDLYVRVLFDGPDVTKPQTSIEELVTAVLGKLETFQPPTVTGANWLSIGNVRVVIVEGKEGERGILQAVIALAARATPT